MTSFTIGIDTPEVMGRKAAEATSMPILKMKLGSPNDRENFAAVRSAAPGKWIRVDANQAWATKKWRWETSSGWHPTDGWSSWNSPCRRRLQNRTPCGSGAFPAGAHRG